MVRIDQSVGSSSSGVTDSSTLVTRSIISISLESRI
eukprot:03658.XXX_78954_79061_1 [CDS] Oithona nana genome sequencing.